MLRFRVFIGLAFALLAGLLVILLISADRQPRKRQRLPDGSVVEIVSVLFSTNISYRGLGLNACQQALDRVLPGWLSRRFGFFPVAGAITMSSPPGETNLAVFTSCQEIVPGYFADAELEMSDDHGNCFTRVESKGTLYAGPGAGPRARIDAWVLTAFPRRSKSIELRFLMPDKATRRSVPVAQFVVPNPCPAAYPIWKPEAPPVICRDADLKISLVEFANRPQSVAVDAAGHREPAYLEMAFALEQDGRNNHSWRPKSIEFKDATGNHWVPFPPLLTSYTPLPWAASRVGLSQTDRLYGLRINAALWPGETAWKVRAEFSRTNDFNAEDLWRLRGVPVPASDEVIMLGAATNLHGARLQLIAISGNNGQQPGNLSWGSIKGLANISIRVAPLPDDYRFALIHAATEQGREVLVTTPFDGKSSEMVYGLTVPGDVKELELTFALHQSRFAEFLVSPATPAAN